MTSHLVIPSDLSDGSELGFWRGLGQNHAKCTRKSVYKDTPLEGFWMSQKRLQGLYVYWTSFGQRRKSLPQRWDLVPS
jgi:hypothetical protein